MALVLGVVFVWLLAPVVMSIVSVAYFWLSPKGTPMAMRLLWSAHGLLGALVFLSAFAISFLAGPSPTFRLPYLMLWAVPVSFVCISLWRFRGAKRTHFLLAPLALAMSWGLVVGYTIVGGGK